MSGDASTVLGGSAGLSARDEEFGHQLVAPRSVTLYADPTWAERAYFLLHTEDAMVLNAGRQLHPHAARRSAFTSLSTGRHQIVRRFAEEVEPGDSPDRAVVGSLRLEVVRPLEEMRLVLDAPEGPLEYDLRFEARFPPVLSQRNRIEQHGAVTTDYVNFFQSGLYSGVVRSGVEERRIDARAGFRDRGWGLRKHEGAPSRGLVLFLSCELHDRAVYLLLYETAHARRVLTNGWILGAGGAVEIAAAEHDLRFTDGTLTGGSVTVSTASSGTIRLDITPRCRLLLAPCGYRRDGQQVAAAPELLDLEDPLVVDAYDGQTDYGCDFLVDGERGHGCTEIGLGLHDRYRPPAEGPGGT